MKLVNETSTIKNEQSMQKKNSKINGLTKANNNYKLDHVIPAGSENETMGAIIFAFCLLISLTFVCCCYTDLSSIF